MPTQTASSSTKIPLQANMPIPIPPPIGHYAFGPSTIPQSAKSSTTNKPKKSTLPPPTPEESRKAFKKFQKGKAKATDIGGHAHSCSKCNQAAALGAAAMASASVLAAAEGGLGGSEGALALSDAMRPPTMSPDCVLYTKPSALINAKAPKCTCPKETTPALDDTYSILHQLFLRRLRYHDLPIVFFEEVAELEKTMIPEMIRDAMLGKTASTQAEMFGFPMNHGGKAGGKAGKQRPKREKLIKLSEYPDAEARLEMREELVSLVKVLGKELLFDSTAPLILEEVAFNADQHGYNSLTHGPPCACVLSVCKPCLTQISTRLIPTTIPQPLPRAPPDHAFLIYSAKALQMQYLTGDTILELDRDDWEEELKRAQKRAGDVLWEIAMELDLVKVTKEVMGMMDRAYDEDFYKNLFVLYKPEPGHEKESFKPVRDLQKIDQFLADIGCDHEDDIQLEREKAEREKEKGNAAYKRGMFGRAIKHFTKAMELSPCDSIYPLNRALAFIKLKKFRAAERDCTTCVNFDPRNTKALYRRALARKGLGLYTDAEMDLNLMLRIEPTNQAAWTALQEIAVILQHTAGSSSCQPFHTRQHIPMVLDSAKAISDRTESENYWKSRFDTTVVPDDGYHRGTSGKPCRAYNLDPKGCPLNRHCPDSHAPDEYSVRISAFNRNVCTNHLLGRPCEPEHHNMDPDEDEDSPYVCPYKHAETEQDKKKVWEETKGIAERLRTDMGLDMKGTQEGFMTALEAITSMRASVLAANSTSDFDAAMSDIAGMIPSELRKVLTTVIDQAKAKGAEIIAEMEESKPAASTATGNANANGVKTTASATNGKAAANGHAPTQKKGKSNGTKGAK